MSVENCEMLFKALVCLHNFIMMGEEGLPVHDRRYCPLDYVDREEDYTVKEGVEDSNIQPTLRIWVE
ncbi:unnamed protein product [Lasius platythorax]|uniref:Uncharacterized protein n=1 Tax=Lasius platythorax TaxID=488582 RepID=A0AAV2MZV9_9HYME